MRRWLLGLLLVTVPASSRAEEILVFAAASLTDALQEIGRGFETKTGHTVRFSFGASSDLARQIAAGAPADVFFSADTAKMDTLEKAGLVRREDRGEFLSNWLAVVVPVGSSFRAREPRDLLALPRIALADPEVVPAGIYARKWLESEGLWKEVGPRVVPTLDVRAALAAVEAEAVPAGIVYKTDARISKKVRIVYETATSPEILYSVARVKASTKVAATRFVEDLESEAAIATFTRLGFVVKAGARVGLGFEFAPHPALSQGERGKGAALSSPLTPAGRSLREARPPAAAGPPCSEGRPLALPRSRGERGNSVALSSPLTLALSQRERGQK
jgi:molybdate transport system substrate-binding protein